MKGRTVLKMTHTRPHSHGDDEDEDDEEEVDEEDGHAEGTVSVACLIPGVVSFLFVSPAWVSAQRRGVRFCSSRQYFYFGAGLLFDMTCRLRPNCWVDSSSMLASSSCSLSPERSEYGYPIRLLPALV